MTGQERAELNNGQTIPVVGLGTWEVTNEDELELALEKALESGYRHFDTAFFHQNEAIIGRVFRKWFESGKIRREDLFIVSKLPMIGMWPYRVNEFLKLSLRDLSIDYVDLYLIQFPIGFQYVDHHEIIPLESNGNVILDHKIHLEAVWKAMEHEVRVGRAKSIGVSNFNEAQLERVLKSCTIPPAVLQTEVTAYFQQKSLRELCNQNKIKVCAYGPLGNSILTDDQEGLINDPIVKKLSEKYGRSEAQIILRFLTQSELVVIPKSTNPERIQNNFKIFDFVLDKEDMKELESLDKGLDGQFKRKYFENIFPGAQCHPEYPWK